MYLPAIKAAERRGFTLTENLVAIAIAVLIATILVPFSLYTATALANIANYADLNGASVSAVDRLTTDIRCAVRVSDFATNRLQLDFSTNGPPVRYQYDGTKGALTRQFKGKPEVLLSGCQSFQFAVYQRYLVANAYDQYLAATNTDTKVIGLKWRASRSLVRTRLTQDELHSAKVILRSR